MPTDIDDFLAEEVKGPGSFECESGKGCSFREPAMNQLINDIFGDKSITLDCDSGECLHYTQVPGYKRPERPDNSSLVALSAAIAAGIFVLACLRKYRRMGIVSFHAHYSRLVSWPCASTPGGIRRRQVARG